MKTKLLIILSMLAASVAMAQVNIVSYEYWFDQDTANLTTVNVTAATQLNITAVINAAALSAGQHSLYMRTLDVNGKWSSVLYRTIEKPAQQPLNELVLVRFWSDTSQPFPTDMQQWVFPDAAQYLSYDSVLDFCSAALGNHGLFYQLLDNRGKWSAVLTRNDVTIADNGAPANLTINLKGTGGTDTALIASAPWGIQWYMNGQLLTGETNDTLSNPQTGIYYAVITNNCGTDTSNSISYIKTNTVGINETGAAINASVYPNPSNGNITVHTDEELPVTVTLTNAVGALIWQQPLAVKTTTFYLGNAAGLYFVTLSSNKGKTTKRIIVQ